MASFWGEDNETCAEINNLLHILKQERQKYIQSNTTLDAVNKFQGNLKPDLQRKLKNICYGLTLTNPESSVQSYASLLGLKNVEDSIEMEEKMLIKDSLEKSLKTSYTEKVLNFRKITGKDMSTVLECTESVNLIMTKEMRLMMDMKKELEEQQEKHSLLLDTKVTLAEELCNLRISEASQLSKIKALEAETELRKCDLRIQVLEATTKQSIFSETSETLKAFQIVSEDMKKLRTLHENEVANLKTKLDKYKMVDSSEFNEILKKYIEYKKYFENKKQIFQSKNESVLQDI